MKVTIYEIRLCQSCGLRYPLVENHPFGERCPKCLGDTAIAATHLIAPRPASLANESGLRLEALLDNIRSAWNVGAIFRTADGLGVDKLYLCGITSTPDNESVHKTSLGTEKTVAWEYAPNALEMAKRLKAAGCRLIALEQDERAVPIADASFAAQGERLVLVLGNEVTGVDPEILDLCDQIVYIPMHGQIKSLNVEVTFGIAVSYLLWS